MSETHMLVAKDKVQRYLSELVRFEVDSQGRYTFRHGSSRCFIYIEDFGDEDTLVRVDIPLLFKVTPTAELYRAVATNSYKFGTLSVSDPDDSGTVTVMYRHTLLGTYLDPEELKLAVALMAKTADDVDTEYLKRFGGEMFHEDQD
ncbi:MAG TPA: hypothetical protein VMM13_16405 [Euzebya sp.]|nr:hypothetical protein [Euzebya sp.]